MRKKVFIIAALLLAALNGSAQKWFDELLKNDDSSVTKITVSKTLLESMPKDSSVISSLGNGYRISGLGEITSKLDRIDIIVAENGESRSVISNNAKKLESDKSYEILLNIKTPGNNISLFGKKEKDGEHVSSMIFFVENDKAILIRLDGKILLKKIVSLLNDAAKNV